MALTISVASGKGGTGKTAVATNLARIVARERDTWLLDCDVEAPNCHLFMKPEVQKTEDVSIPVPVVDHSKCNSCGICDEVCAFNAIVALSKQTIVFSELCHGCGACSRFCPNKAITETPVRIGQVDVGRAGAIDFCQGVSGVGVAIVTPVIRAVKQKVDLAAEDTVVLLDAPPGTGCPVVVTVSGSDYCVLVTEPTPFGLNDLKLAVQLVRHLGIACGVVINRYGLDGGTSDVEAYCQSERIPVLARIPFDRKYAASYARAGNWVDEFPELEAVFCELWASILREISPKEDAR